MDVVEDVHVDFLVKGWSSWVESRWEMGSVVAGKWLRVLSTGSSSA